MRYERFYTTIMLVSWVIGFFGFVITNDFRWYLCTAISLVCSIALGLDDASKKQD